MVMQTIVLLFHTSIADIFKLQKNLLYNIGYVLLLLPLSI